MEYYKLPFKSKVADSLLQKAKDTPVWRNYFNFDAIRVRQRELLNDPFFANLYRQYPYKCGILRLRPNTFYDWHTDIGRGVSINLLLESQHSHTLFCKNYDKILGEFTELKYDLYSCYLFNNKIYHTVYNFEGYRYLFSLQFNNKDLTFDDLYNKIINKEIKLHG
tara:strand:+ start:16 stop:510 length:495 start_codon:yes stop_codon:yes gene_type:complete